MEEKAVAIALAFLVVTLHMNFFQFIENKMS